MRKLSCALEENLEALSRRFHAPENGDFVVRECAPGGVRMAVVYIDGMADSKQVNDFIMRPIMTHRCAGLTDVDQAVEFVERTGCGSLAIAVGNAHGDYVREPNLDFDRIRELRRAVSVPLVLHGCSGIPDEQMQEAVNLGMSKFNIATEYFAAAYGAYDNVIQATGHNRNGVAMYLGAQKEMVEFVTSKIRLLNPNKFTL